MEKEGVPAKSVIYHLPTGRNKHLQLSCWNSSLLGTVFMTELIVLSTVIGRVFLIAEAKVRY